MHESIWRFDGDKVPNAIHEYEPRVLAATCDVLRHPHATWPTSLTRRHDDGHGQLTQPLAVGCMHAATHRAPGQA